MPPIPTWFEGRTNVLRLLKAKLSPRPGMRALVETAANGQPAFAIGADAQRLPRRRAMADRAVHLVTPQHEFDRTSDQLCGEDAQDRSAAQGLHNLLSHLFRIAERSP